MDQELAKRLKDSLAAGLVTAALAAVLAPGWWILLAALAGLAAGFIFYDVREFIATAAAVAVEQFPIIWSDVRNCWNWIAWAFRRVRAEVNRPHPIEAAAGAVGVVALCYVTYTILLTLDYEPTYTLLSFLIFVGGLYGVAASMISLLTFWGLAILGAKRDGNIFRWWNKKLDDEEWWATCELARLRKGLQPAELTNRNGFRWMAKGAGIVIFWLLRMTVTIIAIVIGGVLVVLPAFAVVIFGCVVYFMAAVLVKTVIALHAARRGRLAASVDGVLGGLVVHYTTSPETAFGHVLVVIAGSVIGMAIAMAGYLLAKHYREAQEAPAAC